MSSLRGRLIAWYVALAAFVIGIAVVAVNLVIGKALTYDAQQSLDIASRSVPALVAKYRSTHTNPDGLQAYLQRELSPSGTLIVMTRMPPPRPENVGFVAAGVALQVMTAPAPLPPPEMLPKPGFDAGLVRFFALQQPPLTIATQGVMVALAIDAMHLRSFMSRVAEVEVLVAILVLAAAWRMAVAVSAKAMEPLVRTTKALDRFGDGDFTPEAVSTRDRSELGELARAYNRAVDQITRAFDERSRAEAEMRQFVADAGHQLRTPLTVIMGHLSAMSVKSHRSNGTHTIDSMLAQSRRMKSLIEDLITLARLEHDSGPEDARTDVTALCKRVTRCFDETAQRRIEVHASAEPVYVAAKESELLGVLCALVDNALKYAPIGSVEITTGLHGERCIVSVCDRGPGMSEADLRNAFDRFYRGAAAEDVPGTGLGLAIVRKSIERAGGEVELRNREGGGIASSIALPALSQNGAVA